MRHSTTCRITMIPFVTALLLADQILAADPYYYGPYEGRSPVIFQEVLDRLPKICDRYKVPMRDLFKTLAEEGKETFIARRDNSDGTHKYDEGNLRDGIVRAANLKSPLLQVEPGFMLTANPIEQHKTAFSKDKPLTPVLVYKCPVDNATDDEKIFATIGSHNRIDKKLIFFNEQCVESNEKDSGEYKYLELDVIQSGADHTSHYPSIAMMATIIPLIMAP